MRIVVCVKYPVLIEKECLKIPDQFLRFCLLCLSSILTFRQGCDYSQDEGLNAEKLDESEIDATVNSA